MTQANHRTPSATPADFAPARALAALLRAAAQRFRRIAAHRQAQQAGEALALMDEHMLRDIGVDRADAVRFALNGRD